MKLLLDENLSRRLVPFLQNNFPGTTQVALIGLERADGRNIRRTATGNLAENAQPGQVGSTWPVAQTSI